MATWTKGHNKGAPARNRKLPSDDVILGHIKSGMKRSEIARLYDVLPSNVTYIMKTRGWNSVEQADAQPAQLELIETSEKIVRTHRTFAPGSRFDIVEVLISLPRIPTIHGHYVAAMPSTIGA